MRFRFGAWGATGVRTSRRSDGDTTRRGEDLVVSLLISRRQLDVASLAKVVVTAGEVVAVPDYRFAPTQIAVDTVVAHRDKIQTVTAFRTVPPSSSLKLVSRSLCVVPVGSRVSFHGWRCWDEALPSGHRLVSASVCPRVAYMCALALD